MLDAVPEALFGGRLVHVAGRLSASFVSEPGRPALKVGDAELLFEELALVPSASLSRGRTRERERPLGAVVAE